jgi:hypothetical protein
MEIRSMSIATGVSGAIKKVLLGDTLLPQEFTLGLSDPQTEISVWLRGPGEERDVTDRLSTACAEPFTLCIGFDEARCPVAQSLSRLTLTFCERNRQKRVLGEIGLKYRATLPGTGSRFLLFEPRSSNNFCLPKTRIWTHYLLHAYRQWRRDNSQGIKMTFLERRASMVTFIRPHPIVLVSVGNEKDGNIFPMNLLGSLGNGYCGFALRTERVAGSLVDKARRVALSSVPLSQGFLAYRLANHHTMQSIDWNQLPFTTRKSRAFDIPVPDFAQRVKELEIETSLAIGSHRFFIARIVRDEKFDDGLTFCSIHGFYQSWRLREREHYDRELTVSLVGDAFNKRERHPAKS